MRRLLIGKLVEKVLFSISDIFKRSKMDTDYRCNVFAGEEEVTPRSTTPVESPNQVLDVPELPENGVVLGMNTSELGAQLTMGPADDMPTPKRRSIGKGNRTPAVKVYAVSANASINQRRGAKKRLQTNKTMPRKRRVPATYAAHHKMNATPAAGHRNRSNQSGSLRIPRTFIMTIDEVKGER